MSEVTVTTNTRRVVCARCTVTGLAIFAGLTFATPAMAWEPEDCPTRETHPDCEQYFPPVTPAPEPEPEPEPEPVPEPTPPVPVPVPAPAPVPVPEYTPAPPSANEPTPAPVPVSKSKPKLEPEPTLTSELGPAPTLVPVVESATLPRTGGSAWLLVLAGTLALVGGYALRRRAVETREGR